MAEFDDKLNAILSNPALMGQIMSMAGSLGQSPPSPPQPEPAPQTQSAIPGLPFDPAAMSGIMQLLKSTQLGQREQNLICALDGYLPADRQEKLRKAMQAARIAKYASGALAQGR